MEERAQETPATLEIDQHLRFAFILYRFIYLNWENNGSLGSTTHTTTQTLTLTLFSLAIFGFSSKESLQEPDNKWEIPTLL